MRKEKNKIFYKIFISLFFLVSLFSYAQAQYTFPQECIDNGKLDVLSCEEFLKSKNSSTPSFSGYAECMAKTAASNKKQVCCELFSEDEDAIKACASATTTPPPSSSSNPTKPGGSVDCGQGLEMVHGVCVPVNSAGSGFSAVKDLDELLLRVLKMLLGFAGVVAVLYLVYGGYMYITSGGNEEQAEKGQKALTNAIIGVVIVIMAYTIVNVVIKTLNS